MLVAAISDTHLPRGARQLPAACIEVLRRCDLVIHAGDFVSAQVLEEIEAFGSPVHGVQGNMDSRELRRRLPVERTVEVDRVRIGVIHDGGPAYGRLERLRERFPQEQAVIFGHSHLPLHESRDDFQIFNPGSPTERRRAPSRTMGIASVAEGAIRFEHLVLD